MRRLPSPHPQSHAGGTPQDRTRLQFIITRPCMRCLGHGARGFVPVGGVGCVAIAATSEIDAVTVMARQAQVLQRIALWRTCSFSRLLLAASNLVGLACSTSVACLSAGIAGSSGRAIAVFCAHGDVPSAAPAARRQSGGDRCIGKRRRNGSPGANVFSMSPCLFPEQTWRQVCPRLE
jgi:hypothetical protein